MFESVLIANRGEIACRIIETLRRLGIRSIAVYSDADAGARHVGMADVAVRIGPAAAQQSYLSIPALLAAAKATGAAAIHPGYGFLSENAEFAAACADAGIVFIGPPTSAIDVMGDKIRAKEHVAARGVPIIEGVGAAGMSDADLIAAAQGIGYPLLIKPSAGGGGKGMTVVISAEELPESLAGARRVAKTSFDDDTLLLERYVDRPRHIEVQVMADAHGAVVHLGERECSLQRRHQKIIEEAPSPLLTPEQRARMGEAACEVARSVDYRGAGTVEFLVSDAAPDEFFFMEMNTRLQVEHPVTEQVTGLDLVELQLRIASGEPLGLTQDDVVLRGHAIEARLYSEDPARGFLPSTGKVGYLRQASGAGIRVDSALVAGLEVSADYDPMLAKIIGFGDDRAAALQRLDSALDETIVLGVRTNREFLTALLALPEVRDGRLDTGLIERTEIDYAAPGDAVFAIAALSQELDVREAATGPWQSYRGWRVGDNRPARYRFRLGETVTDVFVDGDTVGVGDGEPARARLVRDGLVRDGASVRLQLADRSVSATVLREGNQIWISLGRAAFELSTVSPEQQLADHRAGLDRVGGSASPDIRTPMPGTVVAVSANTGETVAEGQLLVTIEAMKMEHKMLASTAGVVTIDVQTGDLVGLDQVVARISPHEGAAA
ncbi:MAG TPA: biotin carboxylase N-terminal domain-containing protein [Galbitalea sp.]|jgi:acetyl-CoA/propionyl-CoA carboxylase biotin carboxyl carrier protein